MENHSDPNTQAKTPPTNATFETQFAVPFHAVEVQRSLGSYGKMLRLKPMVREAPNPEFLVRLLTDHVSHQSHIRHAVGPQYKNLENLIRGHHKQSATTKLSLAKALGLQIEEVEKLSNSAPEGPLVPELLSLFKLSEGLPSRMTSAALDVDLPCPCCGKNMFDADAWWLRHTPGLGRNESQFAERLLKAVTGAGMLERLAGILQQRMGPPLDELTQLAHPSRHPVGHWIAEVQNALCCDSLVALSTTLQLKVNADAPFSYGRLKKWSAGQDVMPMDIGTAIASVCDQTNQRVRRLVAARTIALVSDFLVAAIPEDANFERKSAQTIVFARLTQLGHSLRLTSSARRPARSSNRNPSGSNEQC